MTKQALESVPDSRSATREKLCSDGFSARVASTGRAPRKSSSKSRLNWNMLPRSSAPGNPKPR